MRVANMVPDMQYEVQQSQQALAAALQQVSTGLKVNQPSDNPSAYADMVTSLASSANVDQYTSNVSAVTSQMDTADTALSSIVTALNTAITLGTSGETTSNSAADNAAIATQVAGVLSSVVSQANSAYQGAYLFAGSADNAPPFVAAASSFISTQGSLTADTPLTAGDTTIVSDAATGQTLTFTAAAGDTIGTLQTTITNDAVNGTLPAGTDSTFINGQFAVVSGSTTNGIAVTSNDPVLGPMTANPGSQIPDTYVYVGNSTVNTVQVGDSFSVATNVPGDQFFTSGTNVLGSLTALISALQTGTLAQIATATTAVSTALSSLSQVRVPFDNTISQLNSQDTYLSQETLTLSTDQTSLVGADLATAATNLSQAELDSTAVLAAASKVLPETLLNYLAPG
jgi:flagellar hook-associated protein 3 FlgL